MFPSIQDRIDSHSHANLRGPASGMAGLLHRLLVCVASLGAVALQAEILYLEVSGAKPAAEPLRVFVGAKADLTLTLTAATAVEPQVRADLFAVAQTIAAPLSADVVVALQRDGQSKAGVQRFRFTIALPGTGRPQKFAVRLRARAGEAEPWLPLPVVSLETVAETWPAALRAFAERIPSVRFSGHENVGRIFARAGAKAQVLEDGAAGEDSPGVWFAEGDSAGATDHARKSVVIAFKPGLAGGLALDRSGAQRAPVILLDATIPARLTTDPAAQELFERALTLAEALALPFNSHATNP